MTQVTPDQLRAMAAAEDEIARLATVKAELYRRTADALEGVDSAPLTTVRVPATIPKMIVRPATEAPTRRKSRPLHAEDDPGDVRRSASANRENRPLIAAANTRGYSMSRLAREMGMRPARLSDYVTGRRRISSALASQIEILIGFPATDASYPPGGIRTYRRKK